MAGFVRSVTVFCLISSGLESLSREGLLALVALQQWQIENLKSMVARLSTEVAELRAKTNRKSGNSSMPPSSDMFVKPERHKKPSSGRRQGKQQGGLGVSLALVDIPDTTLDVFPLACADCGTVLSRVSAGFARRQCHGIPPRSVQVTETRWHRVRCGCGFVTPAPVPDAPYYGPHLAALAAQLVKM